jgi:outer membrane lipoprotein-sorting protein
MNQPIRLLGIITILTCIILLNSGCTQQQTPTPEETIQTILEKAAILETVSYQIDTTFVIDGIIPQTTTMKIWQKTPYLKEDVTITTINTNSSIGNMTTNLSVIKRPEGIYVYDNTTNSYQLNSQQIIPQPTTTDMVQNLLNNQTLTITGTENLSGIPTTIIQYHPNQGGNTTTVTLWLWNDRGVPLKEQYTSTTEGSIVTITSTYTNYSFEDLADSIFSVE